MKQLMLAAMQSGGGKTTVTCGLLAALKARGLRVQALKSGPDYIDPMFHSRVLGVPSRNLDLFLQGDEGVRATLARCAHTADIALLEGAMGFYDGIAGTSDASAWQLAHTLQTPVILVLRPKGQSLTLAAQVRGLQQFRSASHIAGLLLNDCTAGLAAHLTPILTRETGLPVLGWLPPMDQARVESRHLGLLTAAEVEDFSARYAAVARQMESTVDLDALLALAGEYPSQPTPDAADIRPRCIIAVARDEAFCFYYQDSLDALRSAGAKLIFFSPLHDTGLPPQIDGLYLGGGYPELHCAALSKNTTMRNAICRAVQRGLPTVAECGGFLYLQETLENTCGQSFAMAGALPGQGFKTDRLQRFGYIGLTAGEDSMLFRPGESVPAHEFHYWNSTCNGSALTAQKPHSQRSWVCGVVSPTLYAGFPHLHFGGALPLAQRFVEAAAHWHRSSSERIF